MTRKSRPFDPSRPWATTLEQNERMIRLLAGIGGLQFTLSAFAGIVPGKTTFVPWLGAGLVVVYGTLRIEGYSLRRGRRLP